MLSKLTVKAKNVHKIWDVTYKTKFPRSFYVSLKRIIFGECQYQWMANKWCSALLKFA